MREVIGYSRAQIALHWSVVALIVVSYLSEDAMKAAWRAFVRGQEVAGYTHAIHVFTGVAILLLAMARLLLRKRRGAPRAPESGHPMLKPLAALTHWALYALLVAIPVAGIAAWFGGLREAGEVHEVLFKLLLFFTALHVVGALYHQFVLKDGLLKRLRRPA